MVVFYAVNSRIPDGKVVPFTVALSSEVVKGQYFAPTVTGFPNLQDPEGDNIWLLTVSTTEPDVNGDPIPPEIINVISEGTLHIEIEAAIGRMGQKIDWGTPLPDVRPPRVEELNPPLTQTENVNIMDNILVRLKDPFPAAGMDLTTLNMQLNGFDVIASGVVQAGFDVRLSGNVFDFTIFHRPHRLFS
jgi:hypothetical protein